MPSLNLRKTVFGSRFVLRSPWEMMLLKFPVLPVLEVKTGTFISRIMPAREYGRGHSATKSRNISATLTNIGHPAFFFFFLVQSTLELQLSRKDYNLMLLLQPSKFNVFYQSAKE